MDIVRPSTRSPITKPAAAEFSLCHTSRTAGGRAASAVAELRRAIANGEAAPGEQLPPAKDLAAVLGVKTNTVLRALRLLRDEGLLEFRRGRGITVAGDAPRHSIVVSLTRELLNQAGRHGYQRDDLIQLIKTLP
jgi:GntR family transcriptional regulator